MPSSESKSPPNENSVAVLAFANLSDDKGSEYFSDGISEELLTVLQKIPGLHVAARTSAFSFNRKNATAQVYAWRGETD
jgi:TolB-like protein